MRAVIVYLLVLAGLRLMILAFDAAERANGMERDR